MEARATLWWVDIGMALFVAGFVGLLFLVGSDIFELAIWIYIAALILWSFVAERAAMRNENRRDEVGSKELTPDISGSQPLFH